MNWRQHHMTTKTEAVLSELVEPLTGYISATTCPHATLAVALAILFDSLRKIDKEATAHLATLSENYIG
jgi:methyl coenzyme M reductase subunit C-like uncharacterized protein (methanogenesis marker protein 7)